jgi:Tol biopolymer transport system component
MTRRPGSGARPRPRADDPSGIRLSAAFAAPVLSVVGLAVVAWLSVSLLTGNLPIKVGGRAGTAGVPVGADKTPTPSNVVVVPTSPPGDRLKGTLVYAKDGNIWVQDADGARQITTAGSDSMPSFTPDGQAILYIETRGQTVTYTVPGHARSHYDATYPILFTIRPDGTGRQKLTDGLFTSSRGTWFYWLRQPVMSPDGTTIALFSDAPDPVNSNVVLQYLDASTGTLTRAGVPESPPLGQQDAAWSPNGATLLYVKNGRDGPRGAPQIYRLDWKTKKFRAVTGPGYNSPSWSPDGRFILATKTSTIGTDVVILDARNGSELARVTSDAHSWGGVWSLAGDTIAFLHIDGGVTDLRLVKLSGPVGRWTVGDPIALTENAGLDGASHPDWFIPADELPPPTPAPTAVPSAAASGDSSAAPPSSSSGH